MLLGKISRTLDPERAPARTHHNLLGISRMALQTCSKHVLSLEPGRLVGDDCLTVTDILRPLRQLWCPLNVIENIPRNIHNRLSASSSSWMGLQRSDLNPDKGIV